LLRGIFRWLLVRVNFVLLVLDFGIFPVFLVPSFDAKATSFFVVHFVPTPGVTPAKPTLTWFTTTGTFFAIATGHPVSVPNDFLLVLRVFVVNVHFVLLPLGFGIFPVFP